MSHPLSVLLFALLLPLGALAGEAEPWDGLTEGRDVQTISHGEEVELSAHLAPGKYTVVDFGASWCGPCHDAADALAVYMDRHDDVAVRAVELGGGSPEASYAQPVVAQHLANVSGIPWLVIYTPDGKVLGRGRKLDKLTKAIDTHRARAAKPKK